MSQDHDPVRAAYERDGFYIARGLYDDATMTAWKATLQQALEEEKFDSPSGVRVWLGQTLPEPVLGGMTEPGIATLLHAIIGPEVEYLSAKAVFKSGTTRFGSPWHQDWFYWEGAPKLSVWIALDNATKDNGCLTVLPGCHHAVLPRTTLSKGEDFANRIPDDQMPAGEVLTVELQRGDALIFSDLLPHGSHPNTAGTDRWSIISTYRDATVPDDSPVWDSSLRMQAAAGV